MKYRMIEGCGEAFPLSMMCRCLKVSPSGFYGWHGRPTSARDQANEALLHRIKTLHEESDGVAGAPRIREDLQYAGVSCSKNRTARLMRAHDIRGIPQR
jgi:putative transposase